MIDLRNGDCIEQMRQLPANSVDSIVTDPPYELGFMGKSWDSTGIAYSVKMWDEALRVLKPGGHLIAFSGSRTYHRMACAIEDAGFEIRDQIMWVYGSGFPKSMDVSKAIDKQAGVERERVETNEGIASGAANFGGGSSTQLRNGTKQSAQAITDKAKQWAGWGTALKPAHEPIVLARKPLIGTVATNVIIHGTGALNIDGSRIAYKDNEVDFSTKQNQTTTATVQMGGAKPGDSIQMFKDNGRWPANFIHDGSDEVVELFPENKSPKTYLRKSDGFGSGSYVIGEQAGTESLNYGDAGSAARFFYCAKASKKDRNEGLNEFNEVHSDKNHHPTVKPTKLMRYLVRLVTPPNGTVLDPLMGSGSTGKAAVLEAFNFIGIDQSADYLEIAKARIKHAQEQIEGQLL
jgi:site-specific DNA-methyltransferase (adenine-specific)